MSYNDIDTIANGLISAHFGEYDIFDTVEIFKNIKKSDVLSRLDKVMDENTAHSVLLSKARNNYERLHKSLF